MPRPPSGLTLVVLLVLAFGLPAGGAGAQDCGAPPQMPLLSFEEPKVFDLVRAGGEPSIDVHPDGTILYASHASTTLFYRDNMPDPDYVTPYTGSTYVWRSTDGGDTWRYIGLGGTEVGPHSPTISGFSDPDFAFDAAGNVYTAGINLANVYVAKSPDSGRSWTGHAFSALATDREWLAADEEDVVYMNGNSLATGRTLWKSTDGGLTWDTGHALAGGGPPTKIEVDKVDGRLYFPTAGGSIEIFPNIRQDDFSSVEVPIPGGTPSTHGFLNNLTIDRARNLYLVSNSNSEIRVSHSTDLGETWTTNVIHETPNTVLWPWISSGEDGRVGVSWFEADRRISNTDGQAAEYRVVAAQTVTGHGWTDECGQEHPPVYQTAVATPEPFHTGTICSQGTICQVGGIDRRLGDYHTNAITADGKMVIAYSDTSQKPEGAVSHPGFVKQASGVDLVDDGVEPSRITSLDASAGAGALQVSGGALFGGQAPVRIAEDLTGDAPGGQAGHEAGIDLRSARVFQPDPDDPTLVFEWKVTHLPQTGSIPEGVRYTLPFRIGDSQFQLQAKLTNVASVTLADDPTGHARPPAHFQLRGNCTTDYQGTGIANCPHVAWLEGELDTATNTVRIEVPLNQGYAQEIAPGSEIVQNQSGNATLVDIMATFQAVASTTDMADTATFDENFSYPIPTKGVLLEVFADGAPGVPVASAEVTPAADGTFAGDLDLSGLAPGSYEVRATACFADNCGVSVVPLTI